VKTHSDSRLGFIYVQYRLPGGCSWFNAVQTARSTADYYRSPNLPVYSVKREQLSFLPASH